MLAWFGGTHINYNNVVDLIIRLFYYDGFLFQRSDPKGKFLILFNYLVGTLSHLPYNDRKL